MVNRSLLLKFSVALYQIIVRPCLALDIDSILVHATGRAKQITLREADARQRSSCWTISYDCRENQQFINEESRSLLYEFPSGNQVDGLPLDAHRRGIPALSP